MGLLKKFKNIFVEEVEEDFVPPKKEVTRNETPVISKPVIKNEEIEQPVKVEKVEPIEPKKEEKFVFPVYFDDKDFEKIEKEPEFKAPKPEPTIRRENRIDMKEVREVRKESNYKEAYNKKINEKEEKKIFKPTPIISPVYGILDKNYYKEDIVVTTPSSRTNYKQSSKAITIDDIRNKAFGTLEEDIEQSLLFDDNLEKNVNNKEEDNNNAIFDEFDFANAIEEDRKRDLTKDDLKADIEALLENDELTNTLRFRRTKIEEESNFEEKIEDNLEDDIKEELENTLNFRLNETEENTNTELENDFDDIVSKEELALVEEEIELPINVADTEIENAYSDSSDLNDSDLFNLIDSMYDKEDN